ncbi:peptide chain release factor N(5)-glutamine methyltransferase [Spiractinospora alimapuensis]|uniref:peptide chain release factor N(5)-glutamine methyltransferase n=1 Tax=Spiractinospora alimapuensis TaxID=2820884 RepID=UPI001EE9C20A|nr:peptide chain release factor N(5)-glutamine methyltransferase [Spiractinospora alimapuensis]QVQ54241.1 peptide chain release factor N(5)-glutamine methyltransferase [Spiractinospora alimapuensis]
MNFLLDEIARATQRLAEAGISSPRTDAEELAAFVHGVRRDSLHTVSDAEFDALYWECVARREVREPLQHITGRAYFRYLELQVGPGVFVPRPETEIMVDWAITTLHAMDVADPLVVDLGTGSGAIAISIAQEVPRSRVHAVELDPKAAEWARHNVETTGHAGRVTVHLGDMHSAVPELNGRADLVISNPPYVPSAERDQVPPEVRQYDPQLALWSGQDGLDAVRGLTTTGARLLRPGGHMAIEHGDGQGIEMPRLFPESAGWRDVVNHKDLARRDRFVVMRRAESED